MLTLLREKEDLWTRLGRTNKPIFLYGMGDGAEKIMAALAQYKIPLTGIFASDEFVRGHSFHDFQVQRYSDIRKQYSEYIVLLAFGVNYEPMLSRLARLDRECEFYAPDVPVVPSDRQLFGIEFIRKYEWELDIVDRLLADEQSRRVLRGVLDYKISGKIRYLQEITTEKEEAWSILCPGKREIYADLGGYTGDTIREFLEYTGGQYESILALEPDPKNVSRLKRFLEPLKRTQAIQCAAWDKEDTLFLKRGRGGRNSRLSTGGTMPVPVDSLDRLLKGQPLTFLKLDVEGAEQQALAGAAETICRCRPKIILSGYHRNEDLFRLPLQVLRYYPGYRLYLRHHPYIPAWDTNFYLVPPTEE